MKTLATTQIFMLRSKGKLLWRFLRLTSVIKCKKSVLFINFPHFSLGKNIISSTLMQVFRRLNM